MEFDDTSSNAKNFLKDASSNGRMITNDELGRCTQEVAIIYLI